MYRLSGMCIHDDLLKYLKVITQSNRDESYKMHSF